jgi:hypothetical protein
MWYNPGASWVVSNTGVDNMEPRKTVRNNMSGRLLRALSADEQERMIEDAVRTDWEDENVPAVEAESTEQLSEEASTEMGLYRRGKVIGGKVTEDR